MASSGNGLSNSSNKLPYLNLFLDGELSPPNNPPPANNMITPIPANPVSAILPPTSHPRQIVMNTNAIQIGPTAFTQLQGRVQVKSEYNFSPQQHQALSPLLHHHHHSTTGVVVTEMVRTTTTHFLPSNSSCSHPNNNPTTALPYLLGFSKSFPTQQPAGPARNIFHNTRTGNKSFSGNGTASNYSSSPFAYGNNPYRGFPHIPSSSSRRHAPDFDLIYKRVELAPLEEDDDAPSRRIVENISFSKEKEPFVIPPNPTRKGKSPLYSPPREGQSSNPTNPPPVLAIEGPPRARRGRPRRSLRGDHSNEWMTRCLPGSKRGSYICPRCRSKLPTSQDFASHIMCHYRTDSAAENKRRHLARHRNKNLQIVNTPHGITVAPAGYAFALPPENGAAAAVGGRAQAPAPIVGHEITTEDAN